MRVRDCTSYHQADKEENMSQRNEVVCDHYDQSPKIFVKQERKKVMKPVDVMMLRTLRPFLPAAVVVVSSVSVFRPKLADTARISPKTT